MYEIEYTDDLEKSILASILYFDIFDYPLTLIEVHRFLLNLSKSPESFSDAPLFNDVKNCLERSAFLKTKVRFNNGCFYLRGRENALKDRHDRYLVSNQKLDSSREIFYFLKRVPFVRALFLCNSLAYNNARRESDIDLVIITKRGGVWWARMFCLLVLAAMRARPGHKNEKDKICLSVFIDENRLDFSRLRIGDMDVDFMYWAANFYPIYDPSGLYKMFWKANKGWIQNRLWRLEQCVPHPSRLLHASPPWRAVVECALLRFSFVARAIQMAKFPEKIREMMNQDTRVRVEPGLLKFHVNDRRLEHLEKFVKRYERAVSLRGSPALL